MAFESPMFILAVIISVFGCSILSFFWGIFQDLFSVDEDSKETHRSEIIQTNYKTVNNIYYGKVQSEPKPINEAPHRRNPITIDHDTL